MNVPPLDQTQPPIPVGTEGGGEKAVGAAASRPRPNGEQPVDQRPSWMRSLELPDLPLRWFPRVTQYLEQYKNDPRAHETIRGWVRRFPNHRAIIEGALARERLPLGLAFVAMIESGFSASALSSKGAGGFWQFRPSVARGYGLEVSFWVDERRDLPKSSAAAAKYLGDLHQRFGSWELALAGYNAGVFAVLDSIVRYNTNDYAMLCRVESGLPWETTEYVPKVLAVAIVEKNRAVFGLDEPRPESPRPFDVVMVPPTVTFDRLAPRLHVSADELAALNPIFARRRTPADRGPIAVRVPVGAAAASAGKTFVDLRPDNLQPIVVNPGETLVRVAKARKVSAARLRLINAVGDDAEVTPGTTLLVPRPPAVRPSSKDGPPGQLRPKIASGGGAGKSSGKSR
ncbi:MAG TPA: transglycosylase SLT domain-containing protein [Polyangia bacterium]